MTSNQRKPQESQADIEALWQQLHRIPEPAFKEVQTSAFCTRFLQAAGYQVYNGLTPSHTGIVAVLDSGTPGPTVGLRSDMDCLLFAENGQTVPVHACGHDAHMTIVLTAAKELARQGLPKGKLKIVLQPAEEVGLGAKAMTATGQLADLNYLFGLHLMPAELAGSGQAIAQVDWTACTLLTAELEGRSAHGSLPHRGISALDAGCAMVNAINAIPLDPQECLSAKATQFITGGGSINSICSHAALGFDLRSTKNKLMEKLLQQVQERIQGIAAAYGVTAVVKIVGTCPASTPNPRTGAWAGTAITKELGASGLIKERITTVGEDFNFYPLLLPHLQTGFIGLGCDLVPGLHDRHMHFRHEDLRHGINILKTLAAKAWEN